MTIGADPIPILSAEYGDGKNLLIVARASIARKLILDRRLAGPVVFTYKHPDIGSDSDLLMGVVFLSARTKFSAEDRGMTIELDASCEEVLWTSKRIRLSRPQPPDRESSNHEDAVREMIEEAMRWPDKSETSEKAEAR